MGEINFKKVFEIFKKYDFKGPYSFELEYGGPSGVEPHPMKIDEDLKLSVEYIRKFIPF